MSATESLGTVKGRQAISFHYAKKKKKKKVRIGIKDWECFHKL